ncbi:hypothetical protein Tco_1317141 [Tanacetum coccineum]
MYHQKNVDYVELLWEDFTYQIDNKVYKKQEKIASPMVAKGRKEIHRRREGKRVVLQLRMIVVPVKQNEERTLF